MALPSFTTVGTLRDVLGDIDDAEELIAAAMTEAEILYTSNIPPGAYVKWNGAMHRIYPIPARVATDGTIVNEKGGPVTLLANDDGLNVRGLQWRMDVVIPASVIPPVPQGAMRSFWFNAPADDQVLDLYEVVPVAYHGIGIPNTGGDDEGGGGGSGGTVTSEDLKELIHDADDKPFPVNDDEIPVLDSEHSFLLKKLSWETVVTRVKAYYDTIATTMTNKDMTSGTNSFPTLNQNTTGSAAKLTTARAIDGQNFDGSAAITVIAPGTHAATGKTTPVDADELALVDSAASNVLKKLTWANLKAGVKAYYDTVASTMMNKDLSSGTNVFPTLNQSTTGSAASLTTSRNIDGQAFNGTANITVIAPGTHAATGKTTPVDADELALVDSAASNVLKKVTWANLKATVAAYYDTLSTTLTNKTISGASNTLSAIGVSSLSTTGTASGTTYLRGDGVWSAPAGAGASQFDEYTSSSGGIGTTTKPSGTKGVWLNGVAGGGAGGSGRYRSGSANGSGGGGGAGGNVSRIFIPASALSTNYSLTIGSAAAGGAAQTTASTDGNPGAAGTDIVFTSGTLVVTISGGLGGAGGNNTTSVAGGLPGTFGDKIGSPGAPGQTAASPSPQASPQIATGLVSYGGGAGGGGGSGINSGGTVAATAGVGGQGPNGSPGAAGTTGGGTPGTGSAAVAGLPGSGSGGGALQAGSVGQAGADATGYGAGGGGGSAGPSGGTPNSGKGGNGGPAYASLTWIF